MFVLTLKSTTMDSRPTDPITEQHILDFQEDGAICLRGVFSQKWIDLLRKGIESNRLHSSEMTRRRQEDHTPLFFQDFGNWNSIPEYKEFIFQSPVGEIAGRLLQVSVRDFSSLRAGSPREKVLPISHLNSGNKNGRK